MQVELVELADAEVQRVWLELFDAQQAPANPFCAPLWASVWYRHFAPSAADRRLAAIRGADGSIVAVAPLWIDRARIAGRQVLARLRLIGSGQGTALLELPQVLTAVGQGRAALGALIAELATKGSALSGADWAELSIAEGQGWLEPQWMSLGDHPVSFWRHLDTQASVVIPLEDTWTATLAGLKRNVKESLRRSRNRLAKQPLPVEVHARTHDLDLAVVDRFLGLHHARADHVSVGSIHHDAFGGPERRRFMRALLPELGAAGQATIWELWLGGRQVAAQLILHAPGTIYVHSSGFDPQTWELGPVTHLQEHAFRAACEAGVRWVNMSPGPNLAKQRWSERMIRHDQFVVGFGTKASLTRCAVVGASQVLRTLRHNADMSARND